MSAKLLILHSSLIAELKRERDTMKGCNDLKSQLKKIWDMPVKVIDLEVGALGTTTNKSRQQLSHIWIETIIMELQKTTILYSTRILRNVLEV